MKTINNLLLPFVAALIFGFFISCPAQAKTIKANHYYRGRMPSDGTINLSMKMPCSGYLIIEGVSEGKLYINGKSNDMLDWYVDRLNLFDTKIKKSAHLRITMRKKGGSKYKVRIRVIPLSHFEKEDNNDKKHADKLRTGIRCYGLLGGRDPDWHVFTAPKNGTYTVHMKIYDFSKTYDLGAEFYLGNKYLTYKDGIRNSTVLKKRMKKGQKLYIQMKPYKYRSNDYSLKIKKK